MTAQEGDALDRRPSPGELLERYRSETGGGRGRLRLYLGMAPGVGKTYRMLEEGHRRAARGTDVVVGFVESHGRPLTEGLVTGLEVVPRRRLDYRGLVVEEMDTDAVIARHPTVALVDELAHTNVPGAARSKRWEDVEAIRDAGIHVISTMNVQHLDSLADAVATITGSPVNERIPDAVLGGADEIELVDMSPHALRQRMRHGNVYPPERTAVGLDRFFTEANLTALRELALRAVARRVEDQLEDVNRGTLPLVSGRVLVLLDGAPASGRALRRAAAFAGLAHATLIALVPGQPRIDALSFDRRRDLREAMDAALELGAAISRLPDGDPVEAIAQSVAAAGAGHLFLPIEPTGALGHLRGRPLVERVAARLPDIDVHLVGNRAAPSD